MSVRMNRADYLQRIPCMSTIVPRVVAVWVAGDDPAGRPGLWHQALPFNLSIKNSKKPATRRGFPGFFKRFILVVDSRFVGR